MKQKAEKTGKNENRGQAKTVVSVMMIMLLGKIAGLVRGILISAAYGTRTAEAEAFSVASKIPTKFLDVFFAAAFTAGFIPIFSRYFEKDGKKSAFELSNSFLTLTLLLTAAATALLVIFSPSVISVMAPGFSPELRELTTRLLRIMLPTIILSGAAFSVTGILQAMEEFNAPAAMSLVSNLLIIAYLVFFEGKFGVVGLAAVFMFAWGAQIIVQLPALRKKGFRFRPTLNLRHPGLKEVGLLALPVLVSSWAIPINDLVNTSAVSSVSQGASAIMYSNELFTVITGVFAFSLTNVMFTKFSKQQAGGKTEEFGESLTRSAKLMMFILLPMSAGVFVLAPLIVRMFYERGAFDAESTLVTAGALRYYSLGMLGYGLYTLLSRGFYAVKEGKTPLLTSLLAIGVNAALSFTLVNIMGASGAALAFSVSITITGLIMLIVLQKKKMLFLNFGFAADLLKTLASAAVMAVAVYFCSSAVGGALNGRLLYDIITAAVSVLAGTICFFALAYALGVSEARYGASVLKEFIRGKTHG